MKNEIQTKFRNINKKPNKTENKVKRNIADEQVNESIISIKELIIDTLEEENKLLKF